MQEDIYIIKQLDPFCCQHPILLELAREEPRLLLWKEQAVPGELLNLSFPVGMGHFGGQH